MVSVLDSGWSGPSSSAGRGHCVVFLGKMRNSHSASPPRSINGLANCQDNLTKMLGVYTCDGLASHTGE